MNPPGSVHSDIDPIKLPHGAVVDLLRCPRSLAGRVDAALLGGQRELVLPQLPEEGQRPLDRGVTNLQTPGLQRRLGLLILAQSPRVLLLEPVPLLLTLQHRHGCPREAVLHFAVQRDLVHATREPLLQGTELDLGLRVPRGRGPELVRDASHPPRGGVEHLGCIEVRLDEIDDTAVLYAQLLIEAVPLLQQSPVPLLRLTSLSLVGVHLSGAAVQGLEELRDPLPELLLKCRKARVLGVALRRVAGPGAVLPPELRHRGRLQGHGSVLLPRGQRHKRVIPNRGARA
mmetsp:Transcript_64032/g.187883  ORF Transcript_64032/g.187883 Transcript_64032/m.187883 type:complete len:287 (-) Transcript_64032:136-996(-)